MRIRRRALAPIALMLLGTAVGALIGLAQPPGWTAIARVSIASATSRAVDDVGGPTPGGVGGSLADSYADLATAPIVLEPVIAGLHLHESASALSRSITASVADASAVDITVTDGSPGRSAMIANAVAAGLARTATPLAQARRTTSFVRIVQRATTPTAPTSGGGLDAGIGTLAGAGLVLLLLAVRAVQRLPGPARSAPSLRLS